MNMGTDAIVSLCRQHQGNCPTSSALPADLYEECIVELADAIDLLKKENEELQKRLNNVVNYCDENDGEVGSLDPNDLIDDSDPGYIIGIQHIVIAKTTYHVKLLADLTISAPECRFESESIEEVETALKTEQQRRQELSKSKEKS
jgi:hypothetical protein